MDALKLCVIGMAGLLLLAMLGLILYIVFPAMFPLLEKYPEGCDYGSLCGTAKTSLGVMIMLSLILSGFCCVLCDVLAAIEILKSKAGGGEKLVWLVICFVAGFFGALAYFFIGRKIFAPA